MDETDSFIEEVTEEVRRDKLFALMKKYGWIGIAAILAIVGSSAWIEWQKAQAEARAEAFGDAILAAQASADPAAALAALDETGARAALAQFLTGAAKAKAGDLAGARAAWDAVAQDPAAPRSLSELARLKSVLAAGEALAPEARAAELAALATPGAPYRLLALEAQADDAAAAGKTEEAIKIAREILAEAGVTAGLQQRASQLIVALGGDPAAAE